MGIRKLIKQGREWIIPEHHIIAKEIEINYEMHIIIGVYNRSGLCKIKHELSHLVDKNPRRNIIIGDWNARIGTLGDRKDSYEKRNTRDQVINEEGIKWNEFMEMNGLELLNGNTEGDWNGEYTHDGYQGSSVIDYACATPTVTDEIELFTVGSRTESDHQPIVLQWGQEAEERGHDPKPNRRRVQDWSQESTTTFNKRLESSLREYENPTWSNVAKCIQEATVWKEISLNNEKRWFDKECYTMRQEVKQSLNESKKKPELRNEYREKRRSYKKLLKDKMKKDNENYRTRLAEVKGMSDAWKFINRERNCKVRTPIGASEDSLADHFKTLLQGSDQPPRLNEQLPPRRTEIRLEEEEISELINNLKKRKAAGIDEIKGEALMNGIQHITCHLTRIFNQCLNGEPIPEEWRSTKIWPIHKKGPRDQPENYRGISISNSIYKLWASLLCERLTEEVERLSLLPETQSGFRKWRSATDNIYCLNTCIQEAVATKSKLYILFIDLKAAFDTVNRRRLWEIMERKGISSYIIECCKEIYRKTPLQLGAHNFYTNKGLKQGCPISPILFAIYINDIEETMRRAQAGGIIIGRCKFHTLAYADDMALIAKTEAELKEMMRILERYLNNRDLELNVGKTKVMRVSSSGRLSKVNWIWKGEKIEEVKTFKYLGYTFQSTGSYTTHLKCLAADGTRKLGEVWGIGERRFQNDFVIRMEMFDSLVKSGLMYGCEVFGWADRDETEKVHRKFLKWTLGLNQTTRTAVLMAETNRMPLWIEASLRAKKYELKAQASPNPILRECVMRVQSNRMTRMENERGTHFHSIGWGDVYERTMRREYPARWLLESGQICTDSMRQVLRGKIRSLNFMYNPPVQGVPGYIKRGLEMRTIARFRCGNEERSLEPWREPKGRLCRVCGTEEETLEHLMETCCPSESSEGKIRSETGEGLMWMKYVLESRWAEQL